MNGCHIHSLLYTPDKDIKCSGLRETIEKGVEGGIGVEDVMLFEERVERYTEMWMEMWTEIGRLVESSERTDMLREIKHKMNDCYEK